MMSLSSGRRREKRKRERSPCWEGGRVLTRAMSRRREKERDWTLLPEGIVDCIGGLLLEEDVTEYIRLRGVCASWRHATLKLVLTDPRFHPRNWIFISQLENQNDFRLLNLSTGKYIRAHVPHDTANHTFLRDADGLLVFVEAASRIIYLVNPFTAARISLPPLHEVVYKSDRIGCNHCRIEDVPTMKGRVLSVKIGLPSSSSSFNVVINYFSLTLAYAKAGDTEWSFTPLKNRYIIESFQDQLYSLCEVDRHILRLDPTGFMTVHPSLSHPTTGHHGFFHLVASHGEMLAVYTNEWHHMNFMKVFKVDFENGKLIIKKSIGERALFIDSISGGFSVSTRIFLSLIPGTIYYNTHFTSVYRPIGWACHHGYNKYVNYADYLNNEVVGPSSWVRVCSGIPPSHIIASQLNLYCKT